MGRWYCARRRSRKSQRGKRVDFAKIIEQFFAYGGPWAALYVFQLVLNLKRDTLQTKTTRESIDLLGTAFGAFVERWGEHDTCTRAQERSLAILAATRETRSRGG